MSQELLYTSAPTGLKSGSRGFSTVLCTAGMASNISTRLETLSGYRHVFAPQDSQASLNPVSWSHLRLTINGQPTSILSRIAAYGVDYSGRTNKLAHHVVPSPTEMAQAGPAWLLLQSSWVRSDWDGSCQTPPSGPALPSGSQPVAICQRWQQTTGDAGWGGVLAETIASPASKPLWIVFSIDQSALLLALINESIALMPISQRWRATFSTYYTNLPPEIDCKIRCVLVGTEEAKLAPARGTVIDLTKNLKAAPASADVETARTGVVMAKAIAPVPASLGGTFRSATSSPLEVIDGDALWPDEFSLQPPAVLGKPPGLAMANKSSLPPQLPGGALSSSGEKGRKRRIGLAIGISALAIILLLSAAIPVFLGMKKHADGITELAANGTNGLSLNTETKDSVGNAERFKLHVNNSEARTAADNEAADKEAADNEAADKEAAVIAAAVKAASVKAPAVIAAAVRKAAVIAAAVKAAAFEAVIDTAAAAAAAESAAVAEAAAAAKVAAAKVAAENEIIGWIDISKYKNREVQILFTHITDIRNATGYSWAPGDETNSLVPVSFSGKTLDLKIEPEGALVLGFERTNSKLTVKDSSNINGISELFENLNKIESAVGKITDLYDRIGLDRKSLAGQQPASISYANFIASIKTVKLSCESISTDSKSRLGTLNNDEVRYAAEMKIFETSQSIINIIDKELSDSITAIRSIKEFKVGTLLLFANPVSPGPGKIPKKAGSFAKIMFVLKLQLKE